MSERELPAAPARPTASASGEPGVIQLHEAILREMAEPQDGHEPTPLLLVFGAMLLLGWGGWYLGTYGANFRADAYDERPAATIAAPSAAAVSVDPLVLGKRVFSACQACHQADGKGVPGNFPPLAASEWVVGPAETAVRIVLHGAQGPITVAGSTYDQVMPSWSHFSDEQVAAVLSFVRASFGNRATAVSRELVAAVRAAERDRRQPWTSAELRAAAGHTVTASAGEPAPAATPAAQQPTR